jgi:hypothetical protein
MDIQWEDSIDFAHLFEPGEQAQQPEHPEEEEEEEEEEDEVVERTHPPTGPVRRRRRESARSLPYPTGRVGDVLPEPVLDEHIDHVHAENVENFTENDELIEGVPVFDDLEPKSTKDDWCFLCENRPHDTDNTYYSTLVQLFNPPGNMSTKQIYMLVQKYYNEYFRPYSDNREWTMNSIAKHRTEHMILSDKSILSECKRLLFAQLTFLSTNGMRVRDKPTGKVSISIPGTKLGLEISKTIVKLHQALVQYN